MPRTVRSVPFKDCRMRKYDRSISRSVSSKKRKKKLNHNDNKLTKYCIDNNTVNCDENLKHLVKSNRETPTFPPYGNENSWIVRNWGKLVGGVLTTSILIVSEEIIRHNLSRNKKYGYDSVNDCVRKRSKGKIDICIIGEKNDRQRLINDIMNKKPIVNNELGLVGYLEYLLREHGTNYSRQECCVGEQRAKFENWNIIELSLDDKDIISKMRNDVAMGIFIVNNNDQISKSEAITKNAMVKRVVNPFGVVSFDAGNGEGKPLPFIPVALHCGDIKKGGGGVYGKFISDEGMAYATDLKQYACGRKCSYDEAVDDFSYSLEEKNEYKKKINEDDS